MVEKADIYGIEPQDKQAFNQLIDWWRRQSPSGDPAIDGRSDDAVPIMLLDAPNGWHQGRYCPMMIDSLLPFSYDVCLIGYPAVFESGAQRAGTFQVSWQGVKSQPIHFDATAVEFRQALPKSLRDICKVTGGRIDDIVNGQPVSYRPGRWFVSLPAPIPGFEAVELSGGVYDALVLRVSQSVMACGTATFPCWSLVNRTTAPRIASGSLALGWYVQAFGLMVGVVEPRIYETYSQRLMYPTTTTTGEPTTTTTGAPTTTTEGPPTTTTTSGPTTTTTPGETTTTSTTTTTTTTTIAPSTTTTSFPSSSTTTAAPTTTTEPPSTSTTTTPPSGSCTYQWSVIDGEWSLISNLCPFGTNPTPPVGSGSVEGETRSGNCV